jgi:uncharacterized membrane protein
MPDLITAFRGRPLMLSSLLLGVAVGFLLPATMRPVVRALVGYDAGVWTFLVSNSILMARADHQRMRHIALLHAENAFAVMVIACCAVAASLAAITMELSQTKAAAGAAWPHLLFAGATLVGSWLLLPMLFALTYASRYYEDPDGPGEGLSFPNSVECGEPPDYTDFVYFSITLATTSQTSDVAITRRSMRQWVTAQAILSFAFNTMLLALAVNIAAGLL